MSNKVKEKIIGHFVSTAESYIGTVEIGGDNKGEQVEMFQRAVDGVASQEAWCMCALQYWLFKTEDAFEVESGIFASEHCLTVWNNTDKSRRKAKPSKGDIVIWQYYKNGKATASGHTGVVLEVLKDGLRMTTIEGNTGPGNNVVREGDGVYKKVRTQKGSATMKVVGFLSPF